MPPHPLDVSIVSCRASCALVPPKAEEEFGKRTPWDSVTKLEWVYKKAGKSIHTRRRMIWALSAITDLVRCKMVTPGELSIGGLSGAKRGGRGMLDLVLLKLDLLDALLVHQADKVGLSADSKCKLRTVYVAVRQTVHHDCRGPSAESWSSVCPCNVCVQRSGLL